MDPTTEENGKHIDFQQNNDYTRAQGTENPTDDLVSNWVEATLGDAVLTTEDGNSGTVLKGIPPPAPKSKTKTQIKKLPASAQRKWLMMNQEGETSMVTLNKTELTQVLGVQLRDLRYVIGVLPEIFILT